MALRDYILCAECECKLIYDGSDNAREALEEKYGDPNAGIWTVGILCPDCLKKLEADLAKEREKVKEANEYADRKADEKHEALKQLAAAQAVIEQMREALDWAMGFADSAISDGFRELGGESISDETHREAKRYWESETKTYDGYKPLLAGPANLDALHEARAEALERADRIFMQMSMDLRDSTLRLAYGAARDVLKNEAAAHRARKEGK